MILEEALRAHLLANEGLAEAVGGRVYPKTLPQAGPLPAIVYHRVATVREHSMSGSSQLARARLQLDVWAARAMDCFAISGLLRLALDGFRGSMGGGLVVHGVFAVTEDDDYDDPSGTYAVRMDFEVHHEELNPA